MSHGRAAFLPRVEGLGAMSRSCRLVTQCQKRLFTYILHREGERSPRSPREGRKGSTDERVLDEEELGDRRASLLR